MVCVSAGPGVLGRSPDTAGAYLASYDLEYAGGIGSAVWTTNKAGALAFPSLREAYAAWQSSPECCPLRPDGRPNRPLSAFTVMFEEGP
jgi:hypothetical protein